MRERIVKGGGYGDITEDELPAGRQDQLPQGLAGHGQRRDAEKAGVVAKATRAITPCSSVW